MIKSSIIIMDSWYDVLCHASSLVLVDVQHNIPTSSQHQEAWLRGAEEEYHSSEPAIKGHCPLLRKYLHQIQALDSPDCTECPGIPRTGGCQPLTTAVPPSSQQPNHHQPNDL